MERIKTLSLDLETYSSIDLAKCGVYKYAESPDFEILLFAYSVNEGPVQVVDIACGEDVPGAAAYIECFTTPRRIVGRQ